MIPIDWLKDLKSYLAKMDKKGGTVNKFERLFSPIKIGTLELKNRIVMLPMGTSLADRDGNLSEAFIDYYAARAKGGTGLIVVEVTHVHPTSKIPFYARLYNDEYIPRWKKLVEAVHSGGAKVFPQLVHAGRQTTSTISGTQPVAASPVPCPVNKEVPHELTVEEIEDIVDSFGATALRAREAGCDGVEIHGAHGLLVCNFLSPWSNKRTDGYGGNITGRTRFAVEVIKRIKKKCGQDFPVCFRISSDELVTGGLVPEETRIIAAIVAEAGADIISVSRGNFGSYRWIIPPYGSPIALNAEFSGKLKQELKVPVLTGHRINDPVVAEQLLKQGKADLIGMGRALITDPELPNKAAKGQLEDIAPCISCNQRCVGGRTRTMYWVSCMINPAAGQERKMALTPAPKRKKVLVAGGGLAGMEAARVAALRGHEVTLCEKSNKLGGQFNLASIPPMKQEFSKAVCYFSNQMKKVGVKVEMGIEVTPDSVARMKPDAVVVATGAVPLIPSGMPRVDKSIVVTAHDLLAGKKVVGTKAVIIGGGLVGCETAEYVAERGCKDITILEMLENVAADVVPDWNREFLMERMREFGVKLMTSAKVTEILDDGVAYVKGGSRVVIKGVTDVILATGAKSVNDLEQKIKGQVAEVYVIGDAQKPRKALEAIAEGALIGRKI